MAKKVQEQFPFLFRIAENICLYSIALVPLVFLRSITTFGASKTFFIITASLLAFGSMLTLWLRDRSFVPRMPKVSFVIGGYLLWVILTSLFGADPMVSFWSTFERGSGIISFIAIILFSITLFSILQKKDIRRHIACAMVWGGVLLVVSKYITLLWQGKTFILGDGGLMGNSSIAALYLLFPIAATLYLIFTEEKKKQKFWWSLATLFIITSPFFIQLFFVPHDSLFSFIGEARAACISLALGLGAGLLVWLYYSPKRQIQTLAKILCIISFAGIITVTSLFFNSQSVVQKIFINAASPTRLLYGDIALEGVAVHPITGWGMNTYPLIYQTYFDPINLTDAYLKEGWVDKPHNILLETAATSGLPGLALYLALYGIILISCCRFIRKEYYDRWHGALFFGLFIAYLFQTIFLFEVGATQFIFFVAVTWLFSYTPYQPRTDSRTLIRSQELRNSVIAAIWIATLIGIFYFSYRPAKEAILLNTVRHATIEERTATTADIFALSPMSNGGAEQARILSFYSDEYLKELPDVPQDGRSSVQNELKVYLSLLEQDMMVDKAQYLRTYLTASATASDIFAYSVDKTNDEQYLKKARDYATHAIALSPRNQLGYLELAKTYVLVGEMTKSIPFLQMAVNLASAFGSSHTVLLNVIRASGNTALFQQKLKEAQTAIPGFIYP